MTSIDPERDPVTEASDADVVEQQQELEDVVPDETPVEAAEGDALEQRRRP